MKFTMLAFVVTVYRLKRIYFSLERGTVRARRLVLSGLVSFAPTGNQLGVGQLASF